MRGRRRGLPDAGAFASVLEALIWVRPLGSVPLWGVKLQGVRVETEGPGINLRV